METISDSAMIIFLLFAAISIFAVLVVMYGIAKEHKAAEKCRKRCREKREYKLVECEKIDPAEERKARSASIEEGDQRPRIIGGEKKIEFAVSETSRATNI